MRTALRKYAPTMKDAALINQLLAIYDRGGMIQTDLAEKVGISQSTTCRILRGTIKTMKAKTRRRVAVFVTRQTPGIILTEQAYLDVRDLVTCHGIRQLLQNIAVEQQPGIGQQEYDEVVARIELWSERLNVAIQKHRRNKAT